MSFMKSCLPPVVQRFAFAGFQIMAIAGQNMSFGQIVEMSACRGEIALGIRLQNGGVVLNPARDEPYTLSESDDLIVLIQED